MNRSKALKQLDELAKFNINPRLAAEGWDDEWKTLIATLLSARTHDSVAVVVADRLFKKYNSAEKLAKAPLKAVEHIVKPVNFYKNKARNVLGCAKGIVSLFHGVLPRDINELTRLPGVGRKTANVFLASLGVQAVGVDTHVARISRKLGWTKHINPVKVEKDLKRLFPEERWRSINYILVKFGQSNRGKMEDAILEGIKGIGAKNRKI
jgi:endonuclease-3